MFTFKHLIGGSLFVFVFAGTALAQENRAPIETPREPVAPIPAAPLVTAAATAKRVRFVSPGTVVQLRLEVYNEGGQKLFDTELHGGNVLDWHLQDGAGQRLAAGSYACVLTIKSLSGRLSQRVGLVTVNDKKAAIEAAGVAQLSLAQQQAIGPVVGPVEGNAAFTILHDESEAEAITAVTHDGTEGQVARTRGALSFRLGDFFSGKDTEQMRLTEAGNLGIGTDNPQAKLDVAGVIRTSKGIEFENGTKLTTTAAGGLQQTLADGTVVPNATGTGTQDRLAKWTDNAGALGDSLLSEAGGGVQLRSAAAGVGINPTFINPNNVPGFSLLQAYPAVGPNTNLSFAVVPRGTGVANNRAQLSLFNTDFIADSNNYEFAALRARGPDFVFGTGKSGTGQNRPIMFAAGFLSDNTTNNGQLFLATTGNIGIGTNNPTAKLDVAGNINTSMQYNIGGKRVLGVTGGANFQFSSTFVGFDAGAFSTGALNSFFGKDSGKQHTLGFSNSFFGALAGTNNTSGNGNSFFGYSSGPSNTTEHNNTFIGQFSDGALGITNATAVGNQATVTQSNSLVLGSINGINFADSDTNVGIGTTAPARKLHLTGAGSDGVGQTDLRITGSGAIASGITLESTGAGGRTYSWLSTADNTGGGGTGPGRLAAFDVTANAYRMVIDGTGNVGIGTVSPGAKLDVAGSVKIDAPSAGTGAALCRDTGTGLIVDCSASSARYKQNIFGLRLGLDVVRRLRPVSFTWKEDGQRDVGLVAEDVNRVAPLLVTRNGRGEVEGVRYDRLGVVLLNAVQEQQLQIEQQQNQLRQQKAQIGEQRQQLQQKHLRIEKLEARLAALEVVVKKIGPGFNEAGEQRNHRPGAGLRSRAKRSRTTRG